MYDPMQLKFLDIVMISNNQLEIQYLVAVTKYKWKL